MITRIKVMHDYECWTLWVTRGGSDLPSNERPEDLGLSRSLSGRLEAWGRWGDGRLNLADPHDSRVVSADEAAAFDAEGRLLAKRVRDELPEAVVNYFNDDP